MRGIYVFYADVFLLQNLLMDFAAVTGVNYFLKRHKGVGRLFLGALLSSAVGLVLLLAVGNYLLYGILSHFTLNAAMVLLCFGWRGRREFLEDWAGVYAAAIVLGGVLERLREGGLGRAGLFPLFLAALLIGYGILVFLMQKKERGRHLFPALLEKGAKSLDVTAYWDSGNRLTDPYTGRGISIISRKAAGQLLDPQKDGVRYVPYRSLGKKDGLLAVMDVDALSIWDGRREIRIGKAAVGIAEEGLLDGKEYDVILHASLL